MAVSRKKKRKVKERVVVERVIVKRPRRRKRSNVKLILAIVGLVINTVILPGLGSIIAGRTAAGIIQLGLLAIALVFHLTFVFTFISVPLILLVWIWGIITCVSAILRLT